MHNEFHTNRVLYRNMPRPGHRFRQIVVIENDQFEVRIFEGEVLQTDPKFMAASDDAEVYFHPNLKDALEDVEKEFRQSVAAGWAPWSPSMASGE